MSNGPISAAQEAIKTASANIAKANAAGSKAFELLVIDNVSGSGGRANSYITTARRSDINRQGEIISTGVATDLAVEGAGLMVVSDKVGGKIVLTRRGDFRQDKFGYLKNGAGMMLYAWQLDSKGNLPANSSLTSSLQAVSLANTKGTPVATSVVSIALNLNSNQAPIQGAGIKATFPGQGNNSGRTEKEIIVPDQISGGGRLNIGDRISVTSNPPDVAKILEYGGIAIAKTPSAATPIYGATTARTAFTFTPSGAPFAPNQIITGQKIKITTGGDTYEFTAVQGAVNADNKTFNSYDSFINAVNKVTALNGIISGDTAYIAAADPSKSITFENAGGGSMVEMFGLLDVPAQTVGTYRFNTMANLQNAVNDRVDTFSLKSTISQGTFSINSLLATNGFTINGSAYGERAIPTATIGSAANHVDRGRVYIPSTGNGLKQGDLIRIVGMGDGAMPDGIYSVGSADANGFTVGAILAPNAFPAVGAQRVINPANATWKPMPGQANPSKAAAISGSAPGAPGTVTIADAGHTIVVNDLVYVNGTTMYTGLNNVILPAGYYRVTNVTAGVDFTIGATSVVPGAQAPGFTLATGINYNKIGNVGAAFPMAGARTFETPLMSTVAINSDEVKMYIPNNNYNVGDYITLENLLATGLVFDGVTVNNGTYKILAADDGSVTFATGGAVATAGAVDALVSAAPNTFVINRFTQTLEYLGLNQNKNTYDTTYDPAVGSKSLAGSNFNALQIYSYPMALVNSLGNNFTVQLKFAKLAGVNGQSTWAVEISAIADAAGQFNIAGVRADGQIAAGTLNFGADGKLVAGSGIRVPVTMNHKDGAAPTVINMDWENLLNPIKSGTITQTAAPNDVQLFQQNGQVAGTLTSIEIGVDGILTGIYSSGENRALFQIPIGMFNNPNGLQASSNSTFEITLASGPLNLKTAGDGGSGKTISGAIEGSNVEITETLLNASEIADTMRANARVNKVESDMLSNFLNETK